MARRVRVASRAIRRGRNLRARASEVTSAPSSDRSDDEEHAVAHYSRPPAPTLDFGDEAAAPDSAAPDSAAPDSAAPDSAAPDSASPEPSVADFDDADEQALAATKFSRPPAPRLDFGAAEPDSQPASDMIGMHEGADPNNTTLISQPSPSQVGEERASSRPPPSAVAVEEAAAEEDDLPSTRRLDGGDNDPGFVPEDDEPSLSKPAPSGREDAADAPVSSLRADFFRHRDASLTPVVDDIDDDDNGPELLTAAEAKRRTTLRRGVGIGMALVGMLALGLVGKAVIGNATAQADNHATTPVVAPATPAAASAAAGSLAGEQPTEVEAPVAAESPAGMPTDATTEPPTGNYKEVTTRTLELLNERKFDEAVAEANKLIALEPTKALGYRCLGAALQDLGRISEAQAAYSKCVTYATKGEVAECTALGGSKLGGSKLKQQ